MNNLQHIFFILSIITGLFSQSLGIYFIFKGTFKPQRMTRFIYFILNILFLGTLIAQKSWDAFGLAFAQGLGGTIIFLLSFRYGMGGYEKIDILTLIGAFITIVIWKLTNSPSIALLMSILVDFIAFIPTIVKIYHYPQTEDWRFYLSDVFSSSFSILSLQRFMFGDILYPIYIFLLNSGGLIFVLIRQKQKTKK